MKFNKKLILFIVISCMIIKTQSQINVAILSINVESTKFGFDKIKDDEMETLKLDKKSKNLKPKLMTYVQSIQKKIEEKDVFMIAIQENNDNLSDNKVTQYKQLFNTLKKNGQDWQCDSVQKGYKNKLSTMICTNKNKFEKVGGNVAIDTSIAALKGKGSIGYCYSHKSNDKCFCFLNCHLETNPVKNHPLLQQAFSSAQKQCGQKEVNIYQIGDWNIRPHLGEMTVEKVNVPTDIQLKENNYKQDKKFEDFRLVEGLVQEQEKSEDGPCTKKFRKGDKESTEAFEKQFNKENTDKKYEFSFVDNDVLSLGPLTYKYTKGEEVKLTTEKLYKSGKKKDGKDKNLKYVISLGWLDKLGCYSLEGKNCYIDGRATFTSVPQPDIRIADHMPMLVEFSLKVPDDVAQKKVAVKKQNRFMLKKQNKTLQN